MSRSNSGDSSLDEYSEDAPSSTSESSSAVDRGLPAALLKQLLQDLETPTLIWGYLLIEVQREGKGSTPQ
jgi:hypothetical protein